MSQEIEVRGTTFVSVLGAIEDLKGADFRAQVIQGMSTEASEALTLGAVIATGWYPIRWYRELFASGVEASGELMFARQVGQASIKREVNGVHRLLFKVISVDTLQRQGARFFQSYFRPTDVTLERLGPGHGVTRYEGCVGFDRNLWLEQLGCVEEFLVQAGVKVPRVRIRSGGGNGDDRCEIETRWK